MHVAIFLKIEDFFGVFSGRKTEKLGPRAHETEETEVLTEEGSEQTEEVSDTMAKYMSAIKKDNNRSKK